MKKLPPPVFAASTQEKLARGYTLVELLVVIMIAMLLMVVSLPAIKSVMEDARPREASRILNSTLFTAKSRAAFTGRPAGIEFIMQVVGDPMMNPTAYQCTQMVMCEIPALYAGDSTVSQATVNAESNPRRLYLMDGPVGNGLPGSSDSTTKTTDYLIDQGVFEIRFDFRGPWYSARRTGTETFEINVGTPPPGVASYPSRNQYRSAAFQIRRPPVRVGNPVELPKGTAIDMMFSGIGPQGDEFADTSALRIMFTSEGNLFNYSKLLRQSMGAPTPVTVPISGTVHFLVGVPNKVSGRQEVSGGPFVYTDTTKANVADFNALWVSVSRTSGVVTTNENAPDPTFSGDPSTAAGRQTYIQQCRQYATAREQKGGR